MRYVLRQNLVSLGTNFSIKEKDGRELFRVKGEVLSFLDRLSLMDPEENAVIDIEQIFNWGPITYKLRRDGKLLAEVRRVLRFSLRRLFTVDASGPDDLEVEGDFLNWEYIVRRDDREVATLTRQWFRLSDTWLIEIDEKQADNILVLAVAVVIARAVQKFRRG